MAHAFAPIHSLPQSRRSRPASSHCSSEDLNRSVSSLNANSSSVITPKNLGNGSSHQSQAEVDPSPPPSRPRSPSPAMEALPDNVLTPTSSGDALPVSPLVAQVTSTPIRSRSTSNSGLSYNSVDAGDEEELVSSSDTCTAPQPAPEQVKVPLLGYEIMEERSRFTVFRMQVFRNENDSWFIFRRYTDFARLNDQLRVIFPNFRLALPPKKWFGDNFDHTFLDDRMLGLQAFLTNVTSHRDVCQSEPVRTFLCLDEPPGHHESLEESRALCESMEETIYSLQQEVMERDQQIELLKEELSSSKDQIETLTQALRAKCIGFEHSLASPRRRPDRFQQRRHNIDCIVLRKLSDTSKGFPMLEGRRDSTASAPGCVATYSPRNSPIRLAKNSPRSSPVRPGKEQKNGNAIGVQDSAVKDSRAKEDTNKATKIKNDDAINSQEAGTKSSPKSSSVASLKVTEPTVSINLPQTPHKEMPCTAAVVSTSPIVPQGSVAASPGVSFFIGTPLTSSLPPESAGDRTRPGSKFKNDFRTPTEH